MNLIIIVATQDKIGENSKYALNPTSSHELFVVLNFQYFLVKWIFITG